MEEFKPEAGSTPLRRSEEEFVDALRAEHLNLDEAPPIRVALSSSKEFRNQLLELVRRFEWSEPSAEKIDLYETEEKQKEKNMKNAGAKSYVISPVDSLDKFTRDLRNCTSLIVSGKDQETGEHISLITHQNPSSFLHGGAEDFTAHITERLQELKQRSKDMTIDAVIVGGNYLYRNDELGEKHRKEYVESVEMLTTQVRNVLGFEPVVVGGPKSAGGNDKLYFENATRRAFLVRPVDLELANGSFNARDVEKAKDRGWESPV